MRACALALVGLLTAGCGAQRNRTPDAAVRSACQYLWSQQSADGGWHSRTYGLLRSGQSLTPFVLNALLSVPYEASGVDKAFEFLKRNTNADGSLGLSDSAAPDYPNHATGPNRK